MTISSSPKPYHVIDLFSGAGGLSYGFSNHPAFKVLCAIDILPDMVRTYSLNHPDVLGFNLDIANFSKRYFQDQTGNTANMVDIVVGGPPCQAYSTVGKRLLDDPRGKLFQEYFRILKEFQPRFFIFENVKGLLSMNKGMLLETITALFQSLGYRVQVKLVNALHYGVPQHRERVIITGSLGKGAYRYPQPTHGNELPFITMKEALSDLPLIGNGESSTLYNTGAVNDFQRMMRKKGHAELTEHSSPRNGDHLIEIMRGLPQGGTLEDIPDPIRPKKAFRNSYSRLWWDRPSTTITRNFGTPSSARCIHPLVPRALTTREGARLQSFPDTYHFYGNRSSKNLQIGNSVPPLLSMALAESVATYLTQA